MPEYELKVTSWPQLICYEPGMGGADSARIVGNPMLALLPHKDGWQSIAARIADEKPYHWKPFRCFVCQEKVVFDAPRMHGNPHCKACYPIKELEAVRIKRFVLNRS